jgi:hypothetical protein
MKPVRMLIIATLVFSFLVPPVDAQSRRRRRNNNNGAIAAAVALGLVGALASRRAERRYYSSPYQGGYGYGNYGYGGQGAYAPYGYGGGYGAPVIQSYPYSPYQGGYGYRGYPYSRW